MKKIIMIAGGALLVVGASIGGTLMLMPTQEAGPVYADGQPVATPDSVQPETEPRFYYNVHPEFVINFHEKRSPQFLMLEVTAATNDEASRNAIDDHNPELRNNLIMMLGEQKSEDLKTTEGKDALREKAFAIVDELVTKHYGPNRVTDVFFTRFVMQ